MADDIQKSEFNGLFDGHSVVDAGLVLDVSDRHAGKEEIIAEREIGSETSHPVFTNCIGYNGGFGKARLDDFNEFHEAVDVLKGLLGKGDPTDYIDKGQRLVGKDGDGMM